MAPNTPAMRGLKGLSFLLAVTLILCGCEGVGVARADDPYAKLSQADYLLNGEGRVMQARSHLDEAIVVFQQKGDKAGLAKAYRLYGILARVGGTKNDPTILWLHRDEPIHPVAEELDISDGYFLQALSLFQETQQIDLVGNVNFLLADNEVMRGTPQKACPYYDQSGAALAEARKQHPELAFAAVPGQASPEEGLALAKKQAGCPGT